jgi:hypothetical protein
VGVGSHVTAQPTATPRPAIGGATVDTRTARKTYYPLSFMGSARAIGGILVGPWPVKVLLAIVAFEAIFIAWVSIAVWLVVAWLLGGLFRQTGWRPLQSLLLRTVDQPWLAFGIGLGIVIALLLVYGAFNPTPR